MKKIILAFLIIFVFSTSTTSAATFFFDPIHQNINQGDQFTIVFLMNPGDNYVNAVEGRLKFPSNILKITTISYSDSVVNMWVMEPKFKGDFIDFAGITPGGFNGVRKPLDTKIYPGNIFAVTFEALHSGSGAVSVDNISAFLNDGYGSPVESEVLPFAFDVESQYTPQNYNNSTGSVMIIFILLVAVILFVLKIKWVNLKRYFK